MITIILTFKLAYVNSLTLKAVGNLKITDANDVSITVSSVLKQLGFAIMMQMVKQSTNGGDPSKDRSHSSNTGYW